MNVLCGSPSHPIMFKPPSGFHTRPQKDCYVMCMHVMLFSLPAAKWDLPRDLLLSLWISLFAITLLVNLWITLIMFLFFIENYRNEEEYKNQLIIKLMVVSIIVILSWQTFIYRSQGFCGWWICLYGDDTCLQLAIISKQTGQLTLTKVV